MQTRGINLLGYLSARLGLGEAARNSARVLAHRDDHFASADIMPTAHLTHESVDPEWNVVNDARELIYGVDLFHMNPPEIVAMIAHRKVPRLEWRSTLNVAVPFWELPSLPESWCKALGMMDIVLAPSLYVKGIVESAVPDATIIQYPQAVHRPEVIVRDRARWALAEGAIVFLCMFDVMSDSKRKNPWGAIEAFFGAFPDRSDVRLVIKVNNARAPQVDPGDIARLEGLVASDSRIVLVEESLSRDDLWSLYACCDVFVSLHRAEGLGLGPLEAMATGAAVVATGYSGVMDFMTAENSVPVPYDLVPVAGTSIDSYAGEGEGQFWAEPDVAAAAAALRRLADDEPFRRELGRHAARTAKQAADRQLRGEVFDRLLLEWDAGRVDGAGHRSRISKLEFASRAAGFRRSVVMAMRATGIKPPPPEAERLYTDALRLALPEDRPERRAAPGRSVAL